MAGSDSGGSIGGVATTLGMLIAPNATTALLNLNQQKEQKAQKLLSDESANLLLKNQLYTGAKQPTLLPKFHVDTEDAQAGGVTPFMPQFQNPAITAVPNSMPSFAPKQGLSAADKLDLTATLAGGPAALYAQMNRPMTKDDFVDTKAGLYNIRGNQVVPGTGTPVQPNDFERMLLDAGMTRGSPEWIKAVNANIAKSNYFEGGDPNKIALTKAQTAAAQAAAAKATSESGSTVEIYKKKFGDVPAGYIPVVGPDNQPTGALTPAPGSEKDPAVIDKAKREKLQAELPKADQYRQTGEQLIDNMLATIDRLEKNPAVEDVTGSLQGSKWYPNTTIGIPGIGNTAEDKANAWSDIQNLMNAAQVQGLNQMRSMSPTGGAVGSVSEGEWPKLSSQIANLDPKRSDFMERAAELKANLLKTKALLRDTFDKTYGTQLPKVDQSPLVAGNNSARSIIALVNKYRSKQ